MPPVAVAATTNKVALRRALREVVRQPRYEVVALADDAERVLVRDALDRKDIDALVIAAPNHWHSLMTIWACQAGKDVYVEKPVSHSIWEGRKMVEAARKYHRIVQVGTQAQGADIRVVSGSEGDLRIDTGDVVGFDVIEVILNNVEVP